MKIFSRLKAGIGVLVIATVVCFFIIYRQQQETYRLKLISEIKTRAEDQIRDPVYSGLIIDHVYLIKETNSSYFGFIKYKYPMPKYEEARFGEAIYHSFFEVSVNGDTIMKYNLNPPIDYLFFKSMETLGSAVGQMMSP